MCWQSGALACRSCLHDAVNLSKKWYTDQRTRCNAALGASAVVSPPGTPAAHEAAAMGKGGDWKVCQELEYFSWLRVRLKMQQTVCDIERLSSADIALCWLQRTLDGLIDRGDISSRDLDTRTMDALEGDGLFSAHPQCVCACLRACRLVCVHSF